MARILAILVATVAGVVMLASPAAAGQCPKLIAAIQAEAGKRFDAAAYEARRKAAEAQRLHDEQKHAESEKVAKEALASLGVKM